MSTGSQNTAQLISLPRGGGAQQAIGEKFSPDLQSGTGNFTVPIALLTGRNGFQPQLNLVYSTGNGNGPFGLGWALTVPGIRRKTSRGVPKYREAPTDPAAWDTFILSGAEDLVPVETNGRVRFRPRTEGLFARIERRRQLGADWWEVRSKDGLVSRYGTRVQAAPPSSWRDPAVVSDPADRARIFDWRLSETLDSFGNAILYDYRSDDDPATPSRWTQTYLERIRYVDYEDATQTRFLVSVVFSYEHRPDAFSDHRAGFAIRTGLRCTAITVLTHAGQDRTVRSYRLTYDQAPLNGASLLRQIELVGADGADQLPPLEFGYTRFAPNERHDLFPITGADTPPASLARADYELADVSGDGLPDVIQLGGTARVWRNRGGGRFERPATMREAPAGVSLADPGVQLMDANGDGRMDLVLTQDGLVGTYSLRFDGHWDRASFHKYQRAPSFSLDDPEVKLIDLDGDGVADVLRAGSRLVCVLHDPEARTWHDPVPLRPGSLEGLPAVSFADPRVRWGDFSGDGLQDLALVHSGSVQYWPNQGHGTWGAPVSMTNSPRLPWGYNPSRLLIGDVDGDGLADLVYIDDNKVTLWVNRSGIAWSDPVTIVGTPSVADTEAVRLVDLCGTGITGVLWTADAMTSGLPRANMHFLDLTGATKPYLLNRMDNHLGAETVVEYRASTVDYLRDADRPETRWRTPLPFPVQVVAKVEIIDTISGGKLTTAYRYHHGYWDGGEREFRGFGMVEYRDTETFGEYHLSSLHNDRGFSAVPIARFSPPTLTKTWFHLGPVGDELGDWDELDYSAEFWQGDPPAFKRHPTVAGLLSSYAHRRERRDALRALRGCILRTELYAHDGTLQQDRPYTVTDSQYGLREVPALVAASKRRRIFFPFVVAQRTTQWERGTDPLTQLTFSDGYDAYGQPNAQTNVGLPRRSLRRQAQAAAVLGTLGGDTINETRILATHTRTAHAAADAGGDLHIVDRVSHLRTFELRQPPGVNEQNPDNLHQVLRDGFAAATAVHEAFMAMLETWQAGDPMPPALRLTGHTIHHYDGKAFEGLVAGRLGLHGALTRSEALVFVHDAQAAAEDHLDHAYGARRPAYLDGGMALLAGAPTGFGTGLGYRRESRSPAGYHDGYYADTSSRQFDVQSSTVSQRRGVVIAIRDPRGNTLTIEPDAFWLLPAKVTDPIGLNVAAAYHRRFLLPVAVTDVNDNVTRYTYTPLGLLSKVVLERGRLDRPEVEHSYDFGAYDRSRNSAAPRPIWVHTRQRVWHADDGVSDDLIESRKYFDGFGRLIQTRAQTEDLLLGGEGNDAGLLVDGVLVNGLLKDNAIVPGKAGGPAVGRRATGRVVVSGWQIYDNKGRVAARYEPLFSTGWGYQPEAEAKRGHHAVLCYDPRGHLIRTVNPDGSEQRLVLGTPIDASRLDDLDAFESSPWETYSYDANDLAPATTDPDGASLATRAPAAHAFTPASTIADALGHAICQVARSGPIPALDWFITRWSYDQRGNLLSVRDPLGRVAFRHVYDLQNRLLAVSSIDAGTRTSVFDAAGNLIDLRDEKGAVALRQYDRLNRLRAIWACDRTGTPLTLRERLDYGDGSDPAQLTANRAANRTLNRLGRLARHFDEAGLLRCDRYDSAGNLLQKTRRVISNVALAGGWTPDWAAANAVSALESRRYQVTLSYDALNRPVEIVCPAQVADQPGQRATLAIGYSKIGALERVELDGTTYVERIAYNPKGQRILIIHGNGVMTRYAYDPATFRLVRLRSEQVQTPPQAPDTWHGQGQPLQDLTYTYDLAGNITDIEERTPGCGVAGGAEGRDQLTRRFTYDSLYRLTGATGRACDDIERPRSISDTRRCGAFPPPYQSGAPVPNQHNAPDVTELYAEFFSYDPSGNLSTLTYKPTKPGVPSWTRHFGFGGQASTDWSQAPNNRLTRLEQGTEVHTYQFDANGNLRQANNERQYAWDHADRLAAFTNQPSGAPQASEEVRYLYGSDGMRVKKWVRESGSGDDGSTTYIDGLFEHLRWREPGQGAKEHNLIHVIDGERRIAVVRRGPPNEKDAGPPIQYHFGDHLGSSIIVFDAGANWINREEFFPYGETSFGSYARKRYRFTGEERDEETGLAYHGARYYDPALARWASCDPAGIEDGLNLYPYARHSPLLLNDTQGLQATASSAAAREITLEPINIAGRVGPNALIATAVAAARNAYDSTTRAEYNRLWQSLLTEQMRESQKLSTLTLGAFMAAPPVIATGIHFGAPLVVGGYTVFRGGVGLIIAEIGRRIAPTASNLAGRWQAASFGTQVARYGDVWVKRIDTAASGFMQRWGARAIQAQAEALGRLRDRAPQFWMRDGRLFVKDVGITLDRASIGTLDKLQLWLNAYREGSVRMGTYLNDIVPRNIGANGQIFDPALDPVAQWMGRITIAGGLGLSGYVTKLYFDAQGLQQQDPTGSQVAPSDVPPR